MSMIFFTYRAPLGARKGAAILQEAGISAKLSRTPAALAANGCGYGLWVPMEQGVRAAALLREHKAGFERSYLSGNGFREVSL